MTTHLLTDDHVIPERPRSAEPPHDTAPSILITPPTPSPHGMDVNVDPESSPTCRRPRRAMRRSVSASDVRMASVAAVAAIVHAIPTTTKTGGRARGSSLTFGKLMSKVIGCPTPQVPPRLPSSARAKPSSSSTATPPPSPPADRTRNSHGLLSLPTPKTTNALPPGSSSTDIPELADYQLLSQLGTGAFSTVHLARHRTTGATHAIKIIPKSHFRTRTTRHEISHIYHEIDLLRSLDHKHIVKCRDYVSAPAHLFIVLELLSGGDLFDLMEARGYGQVELAEVWRIFYQVARALEYLHANGVCHRDLKLENVMFDTEGTVKLVDFGLATRFQPGQLMTDRCGSDEYLCPEVVKAEPYDGRTCDVWSLGVILFILLTGEHPFPVDPRRPKSVYAKICTGGFRWPPSASGASGADGQEVPEEWRALVEWMLNPDLEKRATLEDVMKLEATLPH